MQLICQSFSSYSPVHCATQNAIPSNNALTGRQVFRYSGNAGDKGTLKEKIHET
jgi:hypothetical protein